jgi:hypothetical protein
MNIEVMRNTLQESEAGRLTFPEVIQTLVGVGVESYFADLARRADTFYLPNGETHVEPMTHPAIEIARSFLSRESSPPSGQPRPTRSGIQSLSDGRWRPGPRDTGFFSPAGR